MNHSNHEVNNLTKEYLFDAMLILLEEKPLSDISITELVQKAGISRTSFYRHFNSKEEIITEMLDRIIKSIDNPASREKFKETPKEWFNDLFHFYRENSKEILLLTKASVRTLALNDDLFLNSRIMSSNQENTYHDTAFQWAINGIITKWMICGMKESDEEMANICIEIFQLYK